MIVPSGATTSEYWNAIKAGNQSHVRITFLGQNVVLTEADIEHASGISIMDVFNPEMDLVLGAAVCKQFTTSFINSDRLNGLIWTGEFTLEMGVEINGVTEWVTIGYFSGEKPNNITTVQTIGFTAYDRMVKFDILADNYVKNITYPITLRNIYNGLCSYVGIENVAGDELQNILNRSFASAPAEMEGYSCRDILSWIAEACGCYATITEAGKVQLVWFTNTSHTVTGDEEFNAESSDINGGMTWDEADTYTWDEIGNLSWNEICGYQEEYSIDRVVVKQVDNDMDIVYPYGLSDGNTYMIVDNPFLPIGSDADVNNYVVPIYNRLTDFGGYMPFALNCIGNWCIEAGDIITIHINDNVLIVPIFSKSMLWNGSITDNYEATGQKTRNAYTSDTNKQKILNSKEIRLIVNGSYYAIKSGVVIDDSGVKISGGKYIDIAAGSSLNITSGGSIDISASNFSLSSSDKQMTCGNNRFDSTGFTYTGASNRKVFFGQSDTIDSSWMGGVASSLADQDHAVTQVFASPYSKASVGSLVLECKKTESNYYESTIYVSTTAASSNLSTLGTDGYPIYNALINSIFPAKMVTSKNGTSYKGYRFALEFNRWLFGHNDATPSDYPNGSLAFYLTKADPEKIFISPYISGYTPQVVIASELWLGSSANYDLHCRYAYVYREYYDLAPTAKSSREVKHGIEGMPSVGEKLDQLKPVTYIYDYDETETRRPGLIYEDTIDIMPEICTCDESNKGISYVDLIPLLLKEIQDLRKRVNVIERGE